MSKLIKQNKKKKKKMWRLLWQGEDQGIGEEQGQGN